MATASAQTPANRRSLLPSPGTECARHTRGFQTKTLATEEGDSNATRTTVCGIDLHRRRSVIVRMTEDGEVLETVRVDNDPLQFVQAAMARWTEPRGGSRSYLWLVLGGRSARGRRCNRPPRPPARAALGLTAGEERRARRHRARNRLRRGDLPEAWIAPPELRELRELVRYRAKLTALRTSAKAQIHGVMAKEGVLPTLGRCSDPPASASWTRWISRASTASGWSRSGPARDLRPRARPRRVATSRAG